MAVTEYYEFYELREIVENELPMQCEKSKQWLGSGNSLYFSCEDIFEASPDDGFEIIKSKISTRNRFQENCSNSFEHECSNFDGSRQIKSARDARKISDDSNINTERSDEDNFDKFEPPVSKHRNEFKESCGNILDHESFELLHHNTADRFDRISPSSNLNPVSHDINFNPEIFDEDNFEKFEPPASPRNPYLENCGDIYDIESLELHRHCNDSGSPEANPPALESRNFRQSKSSSETPASIRSDDLAGRQPQHNDFDDHPVASWNYDFMPSTFHFRHKDSLHKPEIWDQQKPTHSDAVKNNEPHLAETDSSNKTRTQPKIYNVPITMTSNDVETKPANGYDFEPHHLRNKISKEHFGKDKDGDRIPSFYQTGPEKPILRAVPKSIGQKSDEWSMTQSLNDEAMIKLKESVEDMINHEFSLIKSSQIHGLPKVDEDRKEIRSRERIRSNSLADNSAEVEKLQFQDSKSTKQVPNSFEILQEVKECKSGEVKPENSYQDGIVDMIWKSGKMVMGIMVPNYGNYPPEPSAENSSHNLSQALESAGKPNFPTERTMTSSTNLQTNVNQLKTIPEKPLAEAGQEIDTVGKSRFLSDEGTPSQKSVSFKSQSDSSKTEPRACSRDRKELIGAMEWSIPPALESESVPGGPPFDVGFIYNRIPQGSPAHLLADIVNRSCQRDSDLCVWMGQEIRDERIPVVNTFLSRILIIIIDETSFPNVGVEGHTKGSTLPMFFRKIFAAMNSGFVQHVIISISGNKSVNELLKHCPETMAEYIRKQFIQSVRNNWIKSQNIIEFIMSEHSKHCEK